jgi:hypothetical protein
MVMNNGDYYEYNVVCVSIYIAEVSGFVVKARWELEIPNPGRSFLAQRRIDRGSEADFSSSRVQWEYRKGRIE